MPDDSPASPVMRPHRSPGAAARPSLYVYDSWRHQEPSHWRERSLHWHAYSWRGDGKRLGDNAARRSTVENIVPFAHRDWLLKPEHLVRAAPRTPEDAVR